MSRYLFAIALLCMPLAAATAQGDEGPPRWAANLARKQQVIMHGLPRTYGSLRDPMPDTSAKLRRGAYVFEQRCSSCHGWNGHGAGPEAFALIPAPADLEWLHAAPKAKADPYMYWVIAAAATSSRRCRLSRAVYRETTSGPWLRTSGQDCRARRPEVAVRG
jgi:mono/diheme cytochrome c family protein